MKIPKNARSFINKVEADTRKLIELGLWPIPMARFDGWFQQFCGDVERFFAASVLNQLTLRTQKQFESGLHCMFRGPVSAAIFPEEHDLALAELLARTSDPRVRLVPVICEGDPPTKSGPLVLRRLQRIMRIHSNWMVWPWQVTSLVEEKKIDHIIFADDFLGSGQQFDRFIDHWKLKNLSEECNFVYAPVVAHENGIKYLEEHLKFVKLITTERLNAASGLFSAQLWGSLTEGAVSSQEAQDWFLEFCDVKKARPRSVSHLGFGDLALTYGFTHATPNNTIPLLWHESTRWQPLLER